MQTVRGRKSEGKPFRRRGRGGQGRGAREGEGIENFEPNARTGMEPTALARPQLNAAVML
eukprot:690013-Hanusia_phi.AAC.1